MRRGVRPHRIAAFLLLLVSGVPAVAHENRPLYIELTETASGHYQLQWKSPVSVPSSNAPLVSLSEGCRQLGRPAKWEDSAGMVQRTDYSCRRGVPDRHLSIAYPETNPSISSLVRFQTATGERHVAVLAPHDARWPIPAAETARGVARQYTLLGIEHIWIGWDHLLFLVCLLWVSGTWRRVAVTITGFTLAHSATLILAALGVLRLPIPAVEATIALSIVFLASEIARGPSQSLTWRYPVAVSSSFGLLHGSGFAAALTEIGLPQTELLTGLFAFNVGVEIGQILFAGAVIGLMQLSSLLLANRRLEHVALYRTVVSYGLGAVSSWWLIERCSTFGTAVP